MKDKALTFFVLTLISIQGCAVYHNKPLEHSIVQQMIGEPNIGILRVQAKEIKHPILKAFDINLQDGLSPDEAAIIAVLANPSLRSARDKRGLAGAQLLQANILPNPSFTYSLDIPTAGSTLGTVPGYGSMLELKRSVFFLDKKMISR
jgi:hypothetical protein